MAEKIGVIAVFDVDQFNKGLSQYIKGLDKAEKATDEQTKAVDEMGTTTKVAFGTIIGNVATAAAGALVDAASRMTGAIIGIGQESVALATDFQSAMSELSIAVGKTGPSFDELKQAALAVGGASDLVGVSASGAADAMTGLFKAGLSTEVVFGDLNKTLEDGSNVSGALRAAIDLAAASELDMVAASDLAAVALSSFGSELETDAEKAIFINEAVNNFVQAADASVASVTSLADALVNVGPKAASLGISLEDTNNALAVLSTRGIEGATAGTNLRSMLDNILRTTPKVQQVYEDLGVTLFDSSGEFVGLRSVVEQLGGALEGASDEQKNFVTQTIAGTFGANALNALLAEGVEGWDDMAEATANAATIQDIATAKSQTLAGRMEALDGVLETLKIQFGDALLPIVGLVIDSFTEFAETNGPAITKAFESVSDTVLNFAQLLLYLDGQTDTLDDFLSDSVPLVQSFVKAVRLAAGGIKRFGEIILPVFEAVKKTVIEEVGPDIEELIAKLSELFSDLGITWGDVGQVLMAVATVAGAIIVAAIGIIIAAIDGIIAIMNVLAERVPEIIGLVQDVWSNFVSFLDGIFGAIVALIQGDTKLAMSKFVDGIKAGMNLAQNLFKLMVTVVKTQLEVLSKGVFEFVKTIIEFFQNLFDELVGSSIIPEMVEAIIGWFQVLFDAVSSVTGQIRDFIVAAWVFIRDSVTEIWNSTVTVIKDALAALQAFIKTTFDNIKTDIVNAWIAITESIDTAIRAIPGAVRAAVNTLIQIGRDIVTRIGKGITDTWNTVVDAAIQGAIKLTKLGQGAIDALKNFGGDMVGKIKKGIEDAWSNVTGAIDSLVAGGMTLGAAALSALASIGTTIVTTIRDAITASGGVADALRTIVVDGINEVIQSINDLIEEINSRLGLDLPTIPLLASGVLNFQGGPAIVGEQGPELVTLPRGSNVFPLNTTPNMSSVVNNVSNQQIFNLTVSGDFSSGDIAGDAAAGLREIQVAAALRR